jgi:hypothetical protein
MLIPSAIYSGLATVSSEFWSLTNLHGITPQTREILYSSGLELGVRIFQVVREVSLGARENNLRGMQCWKNNIFRDKD